MYPGALRKARTLRDWSVRFHGHCCLFVTDFSMIRVKMEHCGFDIFERAHDDIGCYIPGIPKRCLRKIERFRNRAAKVRESELRGDAMIPTGPRPAP